MSDQNDYTTPAETVETPAAADVPLPSVTAQEPKLVGDDETQADVFSDHVEVVSEQAAAQVVQPREGDADTVNVHEVSVKVDKVITDTSDPLAVQVPDAGRSPLQSSGLPIARLDAEKVEDVFAREAKSSD